MPAGATGARARALTTSTTSTISRVGGASVARETRARRVRWGAAATLSDVAAVSTTDAPVTRARASRAKETMVIETIRAPVALDALEAPMRACAVGAAAAAAAAAFPEHALAAADVAADVAVDEGGDGGFLQGLLLILFSEIGDKTFFIAVLLALQQDKKAVFAGTYGALAAMTLISVTLGQFLHQLDENLPFDTSFPWDDLLAAALLIFFGVQTIRSADESKAEEEEEDAKEAVEGLGSDFSDEMALIVTTAALVFGAEWGDKSFFATIALAAAADPGQVVAGALAGHFVATAGAVTIGDVVGDYISERVVAYFGGSLFLVFAAGTLYDVFTR